MHLWWIFLVTIFCILKILSTVETIRQNFWVQRLLPELVDHVLISSTLSWSCSLSDTLRASPVRWTLSGIEVGVITIVISWVRSYLHHLATVCVRGRKTWWRSVLLRLVVRLSLISNLNAALIHFSLWICALFINKIIWLLGLQIILIDILVKDTVIKMLLLWSLRLIILPRSIRIDVHILSILCQVHHLVLMLKSYRLIGMHSLVNLLCLQLLINCESIILLQLQLLVNEHLLLHGLHLR